MSRESDLIATLRGLATHPAARGLMDDAAVLEVGGTTLVLTHDMIVENVHFLPDDPPGDVAWKLVAVNFSDLAAKGARPLGVLLGYGLREDAAWNAAFVEGLGKVLAAFGVPLLGGDTTSLPVDAPNSFGMTAIGLASGPAPSRAGARPGDALWVSGTIGDARPGLRIARREREGPDWLVERYRNPRPRLEAGQRIAPLVSAMMDVSDGLLLDADRLAEASGVRARLALDAVPLSDAYRAYHQQDDRTARLSAATAGDDYELLFTAPAARSVEILAIGEELGLSFTRIGEIEEGSGLTLFDGEDEVRLPSHLGYEHG
jgi:thiamine-monophosphate kinase